jgi:hypothetical protein
LLLRFVFIAAVLGTAFGCAPKNVVPISNPDALQTFCEAKRVARLTAVQNILTSLKDGDPKASTLSYAQMLANAKAQTGLGATWLDGSVIMPEDARLFGESDRYMHIKRVVIANVPEGAAPPRPIDVEVRDHGTYRWYTFQAFDTQNVCVEGQRAI